MELVNALIERKIGMVETVKMSPEMLLINQLMYGLDLVRHRADIKWGVDRLISLAPDEMAGKWKSQVAKLNDAIMAGDVPAVEELVAGSIRGYAALERSAVASGHLPMAPEIIEIKVEGVVYRIVAPGSVATDANSVTLEELVRVYHARTQSVFKTLPNANTVASGWVPDPKRSMNETLGF